ncbi:acyl-CoA desaturase [Synechococcus elongatus]|uniref:Delta-9 acyl-phospholipid desaturase n=2 Tax=Synechococcus elongatus TaxID=32046 RepID=Q31K28_SYNE7|nr:fatty acid desaturase [Synechococcus elongatus]ABB58591.1 Delta-9 acyl-phospholipid desaturase [Synechococcus elongatus PCC 7942 = FACHB-805]AJD56956.1 acyl-CoA desaturase [Synechococcus elongatus UTEX 2973]MBD2587311.1 fatty acid desaturase [Synechococcus elongatus FACHB-242]MBD2688380.1 fatty acid desaturase [Synechococcus elongatus FACHB-1061]MBD2705908.1 fatty acid desaturase [Synechococcus elongatus PCC 7942 = FACHB-805]
MTLAIRPKLAFNWPTALFMVAIHIGALLAFLPANFNWPAVGVMVALYYITGCFGITLGWHRLISHRSFEVPKWLEYVLVFCGTLAMQHGPIEWIGLHRHHHLHSDQDVDHHDSNKGFLWSHFLWMIYEIPARTEVDKFTRDIAGDPVYRFFNKYFFGVQVLLGVLLYAWGEAWVGNGWSFVVWGIFARLVVVYHVTWLVNSATHKFGYRSHESGDQSTNCWWVALLAFGEGWHNNHHAYQYSARHGLQWWEFDLTWLIICGLKKVGLARKIKVASPNN